MGAVACERCGEPLPYLAARFCSACGASVAPVPEREVRKTVTLLFTDVTGSTALGEQLDPEAYRRMMGRFFTVAEAAVAAHGGTVEKFVGDAVLAVFGVPDVREDDALRAVRAAHQLSGDVRVLSAELLDSLGVRLEIRTGVNTGSVVAGKSRAGGSFATGDAVNTAARLEQAAGPGEVLLGERTYELVRDAVEVEAVAPVFAKGKSEPVAARRLLSVGDQALGRQRRLDAPLIGRDREAQDLEDALERTVETGRGHLVTVLGAPGMGKTRLVAEFVDRVGGRAEVLRGRCVSYGQGITFWPLVQIIRDAASLDGSESAEVARHALVCVIGSGAASEEATRLLLPLLGYAGEAGSSDQTLWAVARLLEQLALRSPVVVAVDDLHWAEPILVDLLDRLREETGDLPLLMVCQARPELLDRHPSWGQGSLNASVFKLEPFDASSTAESLAAILGLGVPAEVVAEVVTWSGGNPLFVEEIAGHLVETGVVTRSDEGWRVSRALADAGVPATVSALLDSRLGRLPEGERRLLERVSVVGLDFTLGQAGHLCDEGETLTPLLTALVKKDLVRRVRSPGGSGEVWAFRHVLIRDAAYESLPKAERSELHRRMADYLDDHAGAAGAAGKENTAFVAHHLGQASSFATELAPHEPATRELAGRAGRAALAAAEEAADSVDFPAATALAQAALTLSLPAPVRRDVLMMLCDLETFDTGLAQQQARHDEFEATFADLVDPPSELDRAHLRMMRLGVRLDAGEDVADELRVAAELTIALAEAPGDRQRQASGLAQLVHYYETGGLYAPVVEMVDRISALFGTRRRRGALGLRLSALLQGPFPLSDLVGFIQESRSPSMPSSILLASDLAEHAAREARGEPPVAEFAALLAEAEATWSPHTWQGGVWMDVAAFAMWRGDLPKAALWFSRIAQRQAAVGAYAFASTYQAWWALMELELGTPPEEIAALVDLAAQWTMPSDVLSVGLTTAAQAVLASRQGDLDGAAALARDAVEAIDRGDQIWHQADIRRWVAEVARTRGDLAEERRVLTEALELYRRKELVHWQGVVRRRLTELGHAAR